MKQSQGFTRLIPSVITIVGMLVSFGLLALSMRTLPLGTAYTIWTGIGAVGAFVVGIAFLGEQLNLMDVYRRTSRSMYGTKGQWAPQPSNGRLAALSSLIGRGRNP